MRTSVFRIYTPVRDATQVRLSDFQSLLLKNQSLGVENRKADLFREAQRGAVRRMLFFVGGVARGVLLLVAHDARGTSVEGDFHAEGRTFLYAHLADLRTEAKG